MPQRTLPRPIRRWLRKRFGQMRPPAGMTPAPGLSSAGEPGVGSVARVEAAGGGSGRTLRLAVPWPVLALLLVFSAAISAAALIQAYHANMPRVQLAAPGPAGALLWVVLVNGQIYVGNLESTDRGTVQLSDVFFLQPASTQGAVAPPNNQAGAAPNRAQLVRRKDADWHQPDRMSVPIDRIVLLETVGRDSLVARLVSEVRAGEVRNPAR